MTGSALHAARPYSFRLKPSGERSNPSGAAIIMGKQGTHLFSGFIPGHFLQQARHPTKTTDARKN